MGLLSAIQEASGPLYVRFPIHVAIIYTFAILVIGILGFQFLFLSPARRAETSGPTVFNFAGNNIQQLIIGQAPITGPVAQPVTPLAIPAETLIEDGGFEQQAEGWGTGWFEDHVVHSGTVALAFNGARAQWYVDGRRPHTGRLALHVEHESPYAPHVFSSFSQRIKVQPRHRYEVRFWTYVEAIGRGAFALRVVPSRTTTPDEWDKFKAKVDPRIVGRWQEVRREFESGPDRFFDIRFVAETTLTAWVDDVSVTLLGPVAPGTTATR